jgi:hypothetical protein
MPSLMVACAPVSDLRSQFSFGHVLADHQLAQVLQVGQAVEHEDAVHQLVGVLHFADRFLVFLLGQLVQAPVLEHAVVQEVLVDGGQLVLELRLQMFDDLGSPFMAHFSHKVWHDTSPAVGKAKFPLVGDPTHTLTKALTCSSPKKAWHCAAPS